MLQIQKAVETIDNDGLLGKRSLIFSDPGSPQETIEVDIPEDYSSVLLRGVVYDWWGRRSRPDLNIKRVIMPWPHRVRTSSQVWYHNQLNDQYIVEQVDGKLAVAILCFSGAPNNSLSAKENMTGGFRKRQPCLKISFTIYEGDTDTIEQIRRYDSEHSNPSPLP